MSGGGPKNQSFKCDVKQAVLIALGVLVLLAIIFLIVFFVVIQPNRNKSQTTPLPTVEGQASNGTADVKTPETNNSATNGASSNTTSTNTTVSNTTANSTTTVKQSHYLALNRNQHDQTDDSDGQHRNHKLSSHMNYGKLRSHKLQLPQEN